MQTPVFLGSVNRWECDENDHLNVRFYAHKMHQTLQAGLLAAGYVTQEELPAVSSTVKCQHMRYVAEARIAAPIAGYFGVLGISDNETRILIELRHTGTDQVYASYLYTLAWKPSVAEINFVELPAHAGSRGLEETNLPYIDQSLSDIQTLGFTSIGMGVIQPEECDAGGFLLPYQYMGRCSDSMPNLWTKFETESETKRGDGVLGGAVLEYRMSYHTPLRVGHRFEIFSGIRNLAEKTQHMAHIMYNHDTGQWVIGCEAIAVSMDLVARKSVPIPAERRAAMARYQLKD